MDEDPSVLYLIKSYGELPTGPRSPTFDCHFFWGEKCVHATWCFFLLVSNFDYLLFLSLSLYLVQCTVVFFKNHPRILSEDVKRCGIPTFKWEW